jgi:hypothetical protein
MRRLRRSRERRKKVVSMPAPPFDPISLSPFAWWRGDTTDTATDFDWLDKSGNGHTLRQATAADKPTIVTPAEIGGEPALRFDGVSDFLASTEAAATWNLLHNPGATGCEVYDVVIPRALLANAYFSTTQQSANPFYLSLSTGGSNDAYRILITRNDGSTVIDANAAAALAVDTPVRLCTALIDDGSASEYEIRVNNVSGASGGGLSFGTSNPVQTLHLCKRPGMLTQYNQVDYVERLIFDRLLSASERNSLDAYFVARYAL